MEGTSLLVVAGSVFLWGVVSARWVRADLSAPMVFTAVGAALAAGGLVEPAVAGQTLRPLVEVTLVWVLFSDAARVAVSDLRRDAGRCVRLLAVGLPLTVVAGWGLAGWLLPGIGGWLALLVATALAPTDAALGVPVVTNRAVPARVRRLLSVEGGLNDGIATPVVMLALAGAASAEGLEGAQGVAGALLDLVIGVGAGVAVAGTGGALLRWARHRRWVAEDFAGIAVLALALAAYAGALALGGNGFVAAFCGGLAFRALAGRRGPAELVLTEQVGSLVSLLVWLGFGAVAAPVVLDHAGWATVGYAVLSLTVVRMVPVALALVGAGLDRDAVLFVGWFGPRGLASLLFALLALEELGSDADPAVAVIAVTVLLSVVAHGVTAGPLATRYGRAEARRSGAPRDPGQAVADRAT
ncbi:Sodium/hydrogen exchanger [Modestobacter italicus]|uniref:Sodium/hydrogen exchanger n=1 Tax=Modestobacter italicus (strain DSM 44449 / CECT 9708 / BC 501) TaxID=2732864 RepID=I4EXM5_MODI5|nr:cation:proton antiporter [Modestobacter marinus]CCH88138.1 Sodium/hydrogen exchanger [Modestobacter marinus]